MGPILTIYTWNLCYFVTWTYSNITSGCHQHQIGMDYLQLPPFSKCPQVKWNFVFAHYSASGIDRDKILISKPMFFWMMNPMMTLKNPYNSWLTRNSKWLSLKAVEIILIGPWAPYMHPPGMHKTYFILLLRSIPTWKLDATITKLGCTTYMTPSLKFIRLIHQY